ncbi:hypothetical protein ACIBH1_45725 [Nonomuraea sp. NPDC050663]|uniref:hypothetical protein n=1 Tax=Nonomuraea sp. NPDC050663 TaxID=3364370 RepID=UPI00378989B5
MPQTTSRRAAREARFASDRAAAGDPKAALDVEWQRVRAWLSDLHDIDPAKASRARERLATYLRSVGDAAAEEAGYGPEAAVR